MHAVENVVFAERKGKYMSFRDIIKKSIIEGFDADGLTTTSICVILGMAVLFGAIIYLVYRFSAKTGFYNRNFNATLALLPLVTAGIIIAMQSSFVVSLGMVGALSIVRFRNAVKDSIDLLFLFWSISIGIIVGTGLFELALIVSLVFSALIFLLDAIPSFRSPCILIINADCGMNEQLLMECIKKYSRKTRIRSRNCTKHGLEMIVELNVKDEESLMKETAALEYITSVNLLSHDGELRV